MSSLFAAWIADIYRPATLIIARPAAYVWRAP